MLLNADRIRFGGLLEELRNDYFMGEDSYPTSRVDCFRLLNHWSKNVQYVLGAENSKNTE